MSPQRLDRVSPSFPRSAAGRRRGAPRRALALALLVCLLLPSIPSPAGATLLDRGEVNGFDRQVHELRLAPGELANNTTLSLLLNTSATILSASFNFSSRPDLPYVNISGWGINERVYERFGIDLDNRGDFNGDGYPDMAAGATWGSVGNMTGRVDVFHGGPAGYMPGAVNWTLRGPWQAHTGRALSHGDYNGDGYDDLLVSEEGVPDERITGFYGSPSGLETTPAFTLERNFTWWGDDWAGEIEGGLDLNNDSYDDLVVATTSGSLTMFYWGAPGGLNISNVTEIPYTWGGGDRGNVIRRLGDTDGDGLDEVVLGSGRDFFGQYGGTIQVFEGIDGVRNVTSIYFFAGQGGLGGGRESVGYSVAGGQDITGDGIPDLVAGSPYTPPSGVAYIFNGTGDGRYSPQPSFVLTAPGNETGQWFGKGLDIIGDYDGDGTADLVVGETPDGDDDGRAFLYLGSRFDNASAQVMLPTPAGEEQHFGWRVHGLGDANGDGLDDFAVVLESSRNGTGLPGAVWVYNGTRDPLPRDLAVTLGGAAVWYHAGPLRTPALVDITAPLQAQLAAQWAADGVAAVRPVAVNISRHGGGTLTISEIRVRYIIAPPPTGLQASTGPDGGHVLLQWSGAGADISRYAIWSNKSGSWSLMTNVSKTTFSYDDLAVTDGTTYWYSLRSVDDITGYESPATAVVEATPLDVLAPQTPVGLAASGVPSTRTALLSWVRNTDDTDHYELWRADGDGQVEHWLANVSSATGSYNDRNLAEDVNYSYKLRAVDEVGHLSAFAVSPPLRFADTTPPSAPIGVAVQSLPSGKGLQVSWTPNVNDTRSYRVEVALDDGTFAFAAAGETSQSQLAVTGLTRSTQYAVRVVAIDGAGLESPPSAVAKALTVDTQGPVLVLDGAQPDPDGGAVLLTWSTADDDLATFDIFTDASGAWALSSSVAAPATGARVAGLTNGAPAHFRIEGVDVTGNRGPASGTLTAAAGDTLAPAAPAAVTVEALAQGAALRVSWSASSSTDVQGYRLYVVKGAAAGAPVLVATVAAPATQFLHEGLQNGETYTYTVVAFDEIPNDGASTAPAAGMPADRTAPAAPVLDALPARVKEAQLPLSGTGEAGLQVRIWLNDVRQADSIVGANGRFAATLALGAGANTIRVSLFDADPTTAAEFRESAAAATAQVFLDQDAPGLSSSQPATGATGVAAAGPFTFQFNEPINLSSLRITLKDAAGSAVAGTTTYDEATRTATFVPGQPLASGARYEFTVEATDEAGNALPASSVSFNTAGAGSPALPTAGVVLAMGAVAAFMTARRRRGP